MAMTDRYLFTSNYSFGALIARGVLFAPAAGERTDVPFFDSFGGELPVVKGGIPEDWVKRSETDVRNLVPMAAELRSGAQVHKINGEAEYLLLKDVERLVFRSESELKRVRQAPFGDLSLDALDLELNVRPELFEHASSDRAQSDLGFGTEHEQRVDKGAAYSERLRRADGFAGALSAYLIKCPATGGHLGLADSKWSGPLAPSAAFFRIFFNGLGGAARPDGLDDLLIRSTSPVLLRYALQDGWPAAEVLDSIHQAASESLGEEKSDLRRELDRWRDRGREVLSDEGALPDLGDGQRVGARALMLLLLRDGEPDSVLASLEGPSGALQVGREVALLALSMASFRSGLRALPLALKTFSDPTSARRWLEFLGGLTARCLDSEKVGVKDTELSYRSLRALQGLWSIRRKGELLFERAADFDPDLEKVYSMGRALQYDLVEAGPDRLECVVGADVHVELSLSGRPEDPNRVVRFRVPLRASTFSKRTKTVTLRNLKEKPADLLELLCLNAEQDQNCRFAIDRGTGVPDVRVDQLVSTLDQSEYRRHLTHVAEVASAWMRKHAST